MRFLTYKTDDRLGLGLELQDGSVLGLEQGSEFYVSDLHGLVQRGEDALAQAEKALKKHGKKVDVTQIAILPPITRPGKILCVGLNYRDHAEEAGMAVPEYANVFARFATSLVGSNQPIVLPSDSEKLDYEAEFAIVIGKAGRRIKAAEALSHVVGYSLFNDASIRDVQLRTTQWVMGKNYDATGAFGPCLVTADELPPGCQGLRLTATLNGTVVQDGSTDHLLFDVSTIIEQVSAAMTLEPGDVIITGTPAGVGMARKPPLWMKHGDTIEIAMDGLGRLKNHIEAETGST